MPASFRKVAKTADRLQLSNDLAVFFVELTLDPDLERCIASVKAQTRRIKSSFKPYAIYYMIKFFAKVPMSIYLWLSDHTTRKITIVYSNVAGPKSHIEYDSFKCNRIAVLMPALGK